MKKREELRKELNELAPKLAEMQGKGEGFTVPKDYFKALPDQVLEQIRKDFPVPIKESLLDVILNYVNTLFRPRYALALATVMALVVAGIWLLNKENSIDPSPVIGSIELTDLSDDALFSYVSENINGFDKELIVSNTTIEKETKSLQQLTPKPSAEEMGEYLDGILDEIDLEDLHEILYYNSSL